MKQILSLPFVLLFLSGIVVRAQGDNCATATNLGTLPAPFACPNENGPVQTFNYTTVGATPSSPYSYMTDCNGTPGNSDDMDAPAADVWIRFVASGTVLDVGIASTMSQMNVGLWTGACGSLSGAFCDVSSNGNLTTTFEPLAIGTTYYMQISGGTSIDVSAFTLTLENYNNCDICNTASTITTTPAPVNGFYAPNTTVTFCYTVTNFVQISTNWLHGVVPSFGSGWNPATLTPVSAPPGASAAGNNYVWQWDTGPTGTGWWVDIDPNGPTPPDGNPQNNFGMPNISGTGNWPFCFSITTDANCIGGNDLGMTMNTTSDGETGSWVSPACLADPVGSFNATLLCCATLANAGNDASVCSTGSIALNGSYSNTTGTVTTAWTASPAGALAGLSSTTSLTPTFTPPSGITGLVTFTLSVTDAACTQTDAVTINVVTPPTITGGSSVCLNNSVTLSGTGTPSSTIPWTSSNTGVATVSNTGVVTGVGIGSTNITYTNSAGCSATVSFNVLALPVITGTLSVCGSNSSQLSGSGTPSSVSPWTSSNTNVANVSATGIVTGVSPGTTTITYTNSNGCQASATFLVNPLPSITGNLSSCLNGTSQLTGSATPSTTSPWTSSNTGVATVNNAGLVSAVSVGTSTITYTNSNGCQQTALFTVNSLPTISGTLSACVNATSQLTGSPSPAASNPWTSSNGLVATVNSSGLVTGLSAGTTTITYTNSNGCLITATFSVNALPTISGTLTACVNTTSQLTGSGSAAATNPWISSNTNVATINNAGLVTAVAAGSTNITYTNSNGCAVTTSFTVTALPSISGTLNACVNSSAVLTGSGSPSATSPWVSSNTLVATVTSGGIVNGLSSGTTNITYTNISGCSVTILFTVNTLPSISGTLSSCLPGTSALSGSGTASSSNPWTSSNVSVATISSTGTVTSISAGTTTIVYTNSNGCQQSATFTINANPSIGGVFQACVNNTSQLTGSGTAAVAAPWSSSNTGVASVNSTGLVTAISAGNTSITYTNSNGCQQVVSFTVNPLPTGVLSGGGAYCPGITPGTISLAVTGSPGWTVNYTLDGSPATASGLTSPIVLGNTVGTYAVTQVSDALCSNTVAGSQTISLNPIPTITTNATSPTVCNGSNGFIQVNGSGTGNISWTGTSSGNQNGVSLPINISSLQAGTYSVTFTSSVNGCTSLPSTASLNNPGAPILNLIDDINQCGGSFTLPVIGGASLNNPQYFTQPGGMGAAVAVGSVFNTVGSTTLYAFDANGACTDEESFVINIQALPTAGVIGGGTFCQGNPITPVSVNLIGNSPFTLTYSFGGNTLTTISNSSSVNLGAASGTYTLLSVSDANCTNSSSGSSSIVVHPLPTASISGGGSFCTGQNINPINLSLTGSPSWNVSYTLNGVPQTLSGNINPLVNLGSSPGTYVLTSVTDANCSNSASGGQSITVLPLPTAAISGGGTFCSGTNPTPVSVTMTGVPNFNLTYTLNGISNSLSSTTSTLNLGSANGIYTLVSVTDGQCSSSANGTTGISLTALPTASITGGGVYCAGQVVSNIEAQVTGAGNWIVGYTLNGIAQTATGTTSPISLGNSSGTYVLTGITDASCGTSANGTEQITVNALPTAQISGGGTFCQGVVPGNVLVNLTGTPSWTVQYTLNGVAQTISGGANELSLGNSPGTYLLTNVSDALCSNSISGNATISINQLPTASLSGGGIFCSGATISPVNAVVSGSGPWTVQYSVDGIQNTLTSNTSPISLGITDGDYQLTSISDANCSATSIGNASIVVHPLPTATLSGGGVYCEGEETQPIVVGVTGSPNYIIAYLLDGVIENAIGTSNSVLLGYDAGLYEITSISDANCTALINDLDSIVVNSNPNFTVIGNDPSACNVSDGFISLTGLEVSSPFDVSYSYNNNITSGNYNSNAAGALVLSGLSPGNYTSFAVTNVETGCSDSVQNIVTLVNPGAPSIDPINDIIVCDSAILPAISGTNLSPNVSYWSGINGSGMPYGIGDVLYTTDSLYVFDEVGSCIAQVGFVVNVNLTPILDLPQNIVACGTASLPPISGINLSGNQSYFTNTQSLGGVPFNTNTLTQTDSVWIFDVVNGCSDEAAFLVTINPLPVFDSLTGGGIYCENDEINPISVYFSSQNPVSVAYIFNGTLDTVNNVNDVAILPDLPGTYQVIELFDNQCSLTLNANDSIVINPLPPAPIASPDTIYCLNWTPVNLSAQGSGGTITWYSDTLLTSEVSDFPEIVLGTTSYYVAEELNGCIGPFSTVNITFQGCMIDIPTAFTPDGDFTNDLWELNEIDQLFPKNTVSVYNRWGALLFQSEEGKYNAAPWDGTYNDQLLPVGSYYFIIDLNEEEMEPLKGIITIVLR